uniref:Uncharacterized protein n=1 Tax=Arundo donax TaxID=35708 RepID=A0A0A9I078_ARUDO
MTPPTSTILPNRIILLSSQQQLNSICITKELNCIAVT